MQMSQIDQQIEQILINLDDHVYMIGISGYPGSGKSTLAYRLSQKLEKSVIISMDGYHYPRSQLDYEGMQFRGAEFTINMDQMQIDLQNLIINKQGLFPSFDHQYKDPVYDDIQVTKDHKYIIIEGLYIFLQKYQINNIMDLRIFIQTDRQTLEQRLIKRHVETGICEDQQSALERVNGNDLKNGDYLFQNSELKDCIIINN